MSEKEYKGKAKELVRLLRSHKDKLSPETVERIQGWIVSDDSLEQKEREFEALFDELVRYRAVPSARAYRMNKKWRKINSIGARPHRPLYYSPAFRIAAVIVPVLLVLGWFAISHHQTPEGSLTAMVHIVVPDSSDTMYRTDLTDGTDILIRPGTKICYAEDFEAGETRRVVLDSGEVYLDVAHDKSKRFVVETPHLNVNVLGTKFDVEAMPDKDQTVVTLYQGRVLVDVMNGRDGLTEVEMRPGQRFVCDNATGEYRIEHTDSLLPDWVAQRLIFRNTPYNEILSTIEWYYGVSIEVEGELHDDTRLNFRFTGREDLRTALWLFRKVSREFTYEITRKAVKIKVNGYRDQ